MLIAIIIGFFILILIIECFIYAYGTKKDDMLCEYVLVLGAGLYGDQLSGSLKRRLDAAYEYANEKQMPIIVSGGQGKYETISEAKAMKEYLQTRGIKKQRIIMEDASTSTYTNFLNSKKYMHNHAKVMVVTCDFHMYRAVLIGRACGLECYRYPAKSKGIKQIKYYLREIFCLINWVVKHR